jgi:GDP-D-mannose 3',5'-epimerase
MPKKVLVCGAGGFIGGHLVTYLKEKGFWVRGVDIKYPEYKKSDADEFLALDLRHLENCREAIESIDIVYQLAADMGGSLYIFTGDHDADVMHNSALINLHMAKLAAKQKVEKIFYSSSACIYPDYNQTDPDNPNCSEDSAYPANPDSKYGWEKLFSENLYLSFLKNYNLVVKIARFHNIFGEFGCWNNGKEKAPAALCRKVAETPDGGEIEIYGPGTQTRSFLYIAECLHGIDLLMNSDWEGPVNIGSTEMISINNLAKLIMKIAGKNLTIKNIPGPIGVMGRNSDNRLIQEKLGWAPSLSLEYGVEKLYRWIEPQAKINVQA